ncbi:unnamed protein product [Linum trigynum]|uniref:RING-type domain-containing protein n=1 Tax=Linum trigynum TaxID=586398 RepID=A0AAV2GLG4_9ROSI
MSDSSVLGEWGAPQPAGQTTIQTVLGAVAICCVAVVFYSLVRYFLKKQHAAEVEEIQLPTLPQSSFQEASKISGAGDQCSVCLEEFVETDVVSVLPRCSHMFHQICIRDWMAECSRRLPTSLPTCPLCRLDYQETV